MDPIHAGPSLLDEALSYIRCKRALIVVEVDDLDKRLTQLAEERHELIRQIAWMDRQYHELVAQAAAKQKGAAY